MNLDVFADNRRALDWYGSLGFAAGSLSYWLELGTEAMTEQGWWVAHGLAQADVIHRTYGFSEFDLETSNGVYRVGRLADDRLRGAGLAHDPEARRALGALYPGRLVLSLEESSEGAELVVGAVHRLRADGATLLRRLGATDR